MTDDKIYIRQALVKLAIGKTKLYQVFNDLDIHPAKDGKKSYLTNSQLSDIKNYLSDTPPPSEQSANNEQVLIDRITRLESEIQQERKDNKQLTLQVGQWQGRAQTLEQQNFKLLEVTTTPSIKRWWHKLFT